MEKYKELYELSIKLLFEEQNRFTRIDQKAAWYLTALTFLIGVANYFLAWIIEKFLPPQSPLEWVLFSLGIVLVFLIGITWYLCFSVHKVHEVVKMPLTNEMIDFFNSNDEIDIYFTLARANRIAYERNVATTNRKSKKLSLAYKVLIWFLILLTLFSVIYIAYSWSEKMDNKKQTQSTMSAPSKGNEQTPQSAQTPQDSVINTTPSAAPSLPQGSTIPNTQKPNPNINPPAYQVLTEGYDPSKIRQDSMKIKDSAATKQKK